jgi:hypothetical protein
MKCEVKTQMGVFNPRFFFGFSPSLLKPSLVYLWPVVDEE